MKDILDIIKTKRVYFDGGMGSMLQKHGLEAGELPETWNIKRPDIIEDIHRQYLSAGANIITTNTFGVNSLKHDNYRELIISAVECAKRAVSQFDESFIAFDIGPLGRFIEPIGDLPFEEAIEIFAQSIRVAKEQGVDLIIIETMNDSYETKAAVLAAKENSNLPIFVTNVYDEHGKTLTGSTPEAMVALLEGLSVDAIGMNCSLGPDKMVPLIKRFAEITSLPIICNPNAGLPKILNGKTVYSLDPTTFSKYAVILAQNGANILGGCCGTDPEYIKCVIEKTKYIPLNTVENKRLSLASSYSTTIKIGDRPLLIGERINPTGKPKLKQALRDKDFNYILNQAIGQSEHGAHIIDVNVGLPEIDEINVLKDTICAIQSIIDVPLQLDSNNPLAIEKAMRHYNGKPLINSVNGDDESMEAIFPLIKKYGGLVIALTLDKNGIPNSPEDRVEIAKRIISKASEYKIETSEIIFDPLALSIATDSNNDRITLDTVKLLNNMGLHTSLGISNVSFGMPNRDKINVPFFANALLNGLSCAIMNPNSICMMSVYQSYTELIDNRISLKKFNSLVDEAVSSIGTAISSTANLETNASSLKEAIIKGLIKQAIDITQLLLNDQNPIDIINNEIIPALNEVGEAFEKQIIYLPQLLNSAECASQAFALIREKMPHNDINGNSVILATVKGDIHDIGKNIVKLLLESYGFKVFDLGKNVPPQDILDAVNRYNCKFVALSALMTTTLPAMKETIDLLKSHDPSIKVMVGGAVLTEEYSKIIGADFYGKDALSAVKHVQKFYS